MTAAGASQDPLTHTTSPITHTGMRVKPASSCCESYLLWVEGLKGVGTQSGSSVQVNSAACPST